MTAREFFLYQSQLARGGARYTKIARVRAYLDANHQPMTTYFLVAALSYLLGSIPFGYILVRVFRGQDVRQTGSGNIGATNVARSSPALGILTLATGCAERIVCRRDRPQSCPWE